MVSPPSHDDDINDDTKSPDPEQEEEEKDQPLPVGAVLSALFFADKDVAAVCNEYSDVIEACKEKDATWRRQSLWLRLAEIDTICELPEPLMTLIDAPDAGTANEKANAKAANGQTKLQHRVIDQIANDVRHHLQTFHDSVVPHDKVNAVLSFTKHLQQRLVWAMQVAEQKRAPGKEAEVIHLGADAVLPATIYVLASLCQDMTHPHRAVMLAQTLGVNTDPRTSGGSSGNSFGEAAYYLCSFEVALAHLNGIDCPKQYASSIDESLQVEGGSTSSAPRNTIKGAMVDIVVKPGGGSKLQQLSLLCHPTSIHYIQSGGKPRKKNPLLDLFRNFDKNAKARAAKKKEMQNKQARANSSSSSSSNNDVASNTTHMKPLSLTFKTPLKPKASAVADNGSNNNDNDPNNNTIPSSASRSRVPSGRDEILNLASKRSAQRKDARQHAGPSIADVIMTTGDADYALALQLQEELDREAERQRQAEEDQNFALAMQVREKLNQEAQTQPQRSL